MEPNSLIPKDDRAYYMFALKIVGDFGVTLAAPLIIFVLIGRYLDRTQGIGPWGTIVAFVLAALLSGKLIIKKARRYGDEYQHLNEEKP